MKNELTVAEIKDFCEKASVALKDAMANKGDEHPHLQAVLHYQRMGMVTAFQDVLNFIEEYSEDDT